MNAQLTTHQTKSAAMKAIKPPKFRLYPEGSAAMSAVNIELWGFLKCPQVNAIAIAEALAVVPAHHLEGLRSVHYEHSRMIAGFSRWIRLKGPGKQLGRYDRASQTITLHAAADREALFAALFHELGHFVYFRVLSPADRKSWVIGLSAQESSVSRYGERNAAEDFAECYSAFLMRPYAMQQRPLKNRFMRSVVFQGAALDLDVLQQIVMRSSQDDRHKSLDQLI